MSYLHMAKAALRRLGQRPVPPENGAVARYEKNEVNEKTALVIVSTQSDLSDKKLPPVKDPWLFGGLSEFQVEWFNHNWRRHYGATDYRPKSRPLLWTRITELLRRAWRQVSRHRRLRKPDPLKAIASGYPHGTPEQPRIPGQCYLCGGLTEPSIRSDDEEEEPVDFCFCATIAPTHRMTPYWRPLRQCSNCTHEISPLAPTDLCGRCAARVWASA
jgi:hypothetical protein